MTYLDKLIIILGFILSCLSAVIIGNTPAVTTYEISIYEAYPFYLWILLLGSLCCGMVVLVRKAFQKQTDSRLYLIGFLLLVLTNLIIISLPIFRGYFIRSAGDEITHLGWMVDILNTGHLGGSDIYPLSHMLSVQISLICGLDVRTGINIVPICFYILYALGLLLLAHEISRKLGQIYLILAFSSVLLYTYFNYLFFPTQFILCALPLVLYLYLKSNSPTNLKYGICLVIFLLALPLLHPLGSLLICLVLIILNISSLLTRIILRRKSSTLESNLNPRINNWTPVLTAFVAFILWFSNFAMFRSSISNAWMVFSMGGISPISQINSGIVERNYSFIDTVLRIVKNNGQDILFAFLAILAIFLLIKRYFSRRDSLTSLEIFSMTSFVVFLIFAISTIASNFLGTGSSLRIFCWPLLFTIIVNGLVYQDSLSHLRGPIKNMAISVLFILIFFSATIGVFNNYSSPIIDNGNAQVTRSEWVGMEWLLKNKRDYGTYCFDQLPERSPDYYYGTDSPKPSTTGAFYDMPLNLGYDRRSSLKNILPFDAYIVITEQVKIQKSMINPYTGSYTVAELDRMYSDPGVNFIYTSRGTDVGLVIK